MAATRIYSTPALVLQPAFEQRIASYLQRATQRLQPVHSRASCSWARSGIFRNSRILPGWRSTQLCRLEKTSAISTSNAMRLKVEETSSSEPQQVGYNFCFVTLVSSSLRPLYCSSLQRGWLFAFVRKKMSILSFDRSSEFCASHTRALDSRHHFNNVKNTANPMKSPNNQPLQRPDSPQPSNRHSNSLQSSTRTSTTCLISLRSPGSSRLRLSAILSSTITICTHFHSSHMPRSRIFSMAGLHGNGSFRPSSEVSLIPWPTSSS